MAIKRTEKSDERPTFDFSEAEPNRYATRYAEGTNIVHLDDDLLVHFPDSDAVNKALRGLLDLARVIKK